MSLWFRKRDKNAAVHLILIPFEPMSWIMLFGLAAAFILPLLFTLRAAVIQSPGWALAGVLAALVLGLAMFTTAKLSVIRTGPLVSFGPGRMSRLMRFFYVAGYVLMAGGVASVFFLPLWLMP